MKPKDHSQPVQGSASNTEAPRGLPGQGQVKYFSIWVPGDPVPQPRLRPVMRGGKVARMIEVSTRHGYSSRPWKDWVRSHAGLAGAPVFEGPLAMALVFKLARPKSHFRKDGTLRKGAPEFPVGVPDLDDLVHAVQDAFGRLRVGTRRVGDAVLFNNDSQVVHIRAMKVYAEGRGPGVFIECMALSAQSD